MFTPAGFYRGNTAHERIWKTKSGKAEFTTPTSLTSTGFKDAPGRYRLLTMRSNDQFNTTIYGLSDRLRGIEGTRDVLLINPDDIARAGLVDGQMVSLVSDADDRIHRGGQTIEDYPVQPAWRLRRFVLSGNEPSHCLVASRREVQNACQ